MSGQVQPRDQRQKLAESEFQAGVGDHVGFDWAGCDFGESVADAKADELLERFGWLGMTPSLASAVAAHMLEVGGSGVGDDQRRIFEATLRLTLEAITADKRPALAADCHRVAFGFHHGGGDSMRAIGRRHGVTVEAVSKRADRLRREYGLDENVFNRPQHHSAIYAASNRSKDEL